mmetsp:Transcript_1745/g.6142  ORF Transcript_1745/g.6142 Transcript_1745/m.6142 type:complete len:769 (+) Transcript_1745:331-2637(+)
MSSVGLMLPRLNSTLSGVDINALLQDPTLFSYDSVGHALQGTNGAQQVQARDGHTLAGPAVGVGHLVPRGAPALAQPDSGKEGKGKDASDNGPDTVRSESIVDIRTARSNEKDQTATTEEIQRAIDPHQRVGHCPVYNAAVATLLRTVSSLGAQHQLNFLQATECVQHSGRHEGDSKENVQNGATLNTQMNMNVNMSVHVSKGLEDGSVSKPHEQGRPSGVSGSDLLREESAFAPGINPLDRQYSNFYGLAQTLNDFMGSDASHTKSMTTESILDRLPSLGTLPNLALDRTLSNICLERQLSISRLQGETAGAALFRAPAQASHGTSSLFSAPSQLLSQPSIPITLIPVPNHNSAGLRVSHGPSIEIALPAPDANRGTGRKNARQESPPTPGSSVRKPRGRRQSKTGAGMPPPEPLASIRGSVGHGQFPTGLPHVDDAIQVPKTPQPGDEPGQAVGKKRKAPTSPARDGKKSSAKKSTVTCATQSPASTGKGRKAGGYTKTSSRFRGVTRHRITGRFEAHLWDNEKRGPKQRGRQVYLGGYETEEAAAMAFDRAALKFFGYGTCTNFPIQSISQEEIQRLDAMTREEVVADLRRKSSGFSRGASSYRGVTRHHQHGRWEARIGRVQGNKYLYLGTYDSEKAAAEAYDRAAIRYRGSAAVTNFPISNYLQDAEVVKYLHSSEGQSAAPSAQHNRREPQSCCTYVSHEAMGAAEPVQALPAAPMMQHRAPEPLVPQTLSSLISQGSLDFNSVPDNQNGLAPFPSSFFARA